MLQATLVTSSYELEQIHQLNQLNIKHHVDEKTQVDEGFVSWLYPVSLLQQMHELAPAVIIKEGETVAGYALTTLREAGAFHPDLRIMFKNLETVQYQGRPLSDHHFYCMGQICVAKAYRGKGLVGLLYQKHKEVYGRQYDFILTEIATRNIRSIKAHEKIGFRTIHTYRDHMDEWAVVIWDWL